MAENATGPSFVGDFVAEMRATVLPIARHVVEVSPADELFFEFQAALQVMARACEGASQGAVQGLSSLWFPGGAAGQGGFRDLLETLSALASAWEQFRTRCSAEGWDFVLAFSDQVSVDLEPLSGAELLLAENRALHVLLNWSTEALGDRSLFGVS